MLFSAEDLYSEDQAITATAVSTNVIDHGADADIGIGTPVPILIQVTEAFNNLTNLKIDIETDDNEDFSSATVIYTETIVLANLTAGAKTWLHLFGRNNERYTRLNYTVTGTAPTAGKVTAGLLFSQQDNQAYPDALGAIGS